MGLFKPNKATASAVQRPGRYAFLTSMLLLFVFIVIGVAQGNIGLGLLIGGVIAICAGGLNYFFFRKGGWGERWYTRNRDQPE